MEEKPVEVGEEVKLHTRLGDSNLGKAIKGFYGDEDFPIEWGDEPIYPWLFDDVEEEKKIFWYRSDAHYPLIFMPLHEDILSCWDQYKLTAPGRTSMWMYDRYWDPRGMVWLVRREGARLYQGHVKPPEEEIEKRKKFFETMVPVYANYTIETWNRLKEKSKRNLEYLDSIEPEELSLEELLLKFQDALDIYEEHWRYHWYVNFSYYLMLTTFVERWKEILGEDTFDAEIMARISISTKDANWDRQKEMYELKERIKDDPELKEAVEEAETGEELLKKLKEMGKDEFLGDMWDYLEDYGWTSPYVHEMQVETWYERPELFLDQLRERYVTDYDYEKEHQDAAERHEDGIRRFEEILKEADISEEEEEEIRECFRSAAELAPVNPDHHFYYDQGTQTRFWYIIRAIGKRLKEKDLLENYDDVYYLRYDELRNICTDPEAFDSKKKAKDMREKLEKEYRERPYIMYFGTATEWALDEEFWRGYWGWDRDRLERAEEIREIITGKKKPPKVLKGAATGTPAGEGTAKRVITPEDFEKVEEGDVAVAIMTSPAWANLFSRLGGLITDSGSPNAHPAIYSRIYNVPCVVGTEVATDVIEEGQRVKVDGGNGKVEVLGS